MTKTLLIETIAARSGTTKVAAAAMIEAVLAALKDSLARDESICLAGFGTLEVVDRAARAGRNPLTGLPMRIPPCRTVRFRAGKDLAGKIA